MSFLDTETEQTPELIQRYKTAIENAKHEDYYLFKLRGLMRYMGKDIEGNEVLLFVPCLVTATGTIYDHAL
ncbi:rhoGAP protein, putative [Eimeria maxima]|uniref:RhoGAP protein, putative n=1 Tax=Eimeria maxima TaxID=5804 RepID=U6M4Z6_EIMMA|nr:rhoGAP protein, putative [Eimeria maxima]CDJ59081.1 rhoGAP protein, putative [Eimeria maxima]